VKRRDLSAKAGTKALLPLEGRTGQIYDSKFRKTQHFSFFKKSLNPPSSPFSKGEKAEGFIYIYLQSSPPFEKGGREGFPGRGFQNTKLIPFFKELKCYKNLKWYEFFILPIRAGMFNTIFLKPASFGARG
jgi:hypothetical protein